jgi:serine/threonine protein kinase
VTAGREAFEGTTRFQLRRWLGAGGFGVVHEAFDRETGSVIALKILRRSDSSALYRFKQEFRSLADVVHPNLVSLYELHWESGRWFFTMELVDGVSFLEHVWDDPAAQRGDSSNALDTRTRSRLQGSSTYDVGDSGPSGERATQGMRVVDPRGSDPAESPVGPMPARPPRPIDLDRLRLALGQLAEGLTALHDAGKLHRDVKPSNVLVTREGRVVLLDFGLVSERIAPHESDHVVGTTSYMSPEQGAGLALTDASDWYSVGCMLFEALTGDVPFRGPWQRVVNDRLRFEPGSPAQVVPGVPDDLDRLCHDLLRRAPALRVTGREVLRRLGRSGPRSVTPVVATALPGSGLVGRARHLDVLGDAFERVKQGTPTAVWVYGLSGMGKTALVRRFLQELRARERSVVVLAGRCYERESVPYKALDSLVDALVQHLRTLAPHEVQLLLPADLPALARLFPVVAQVEAVAGGRWRALGIPDSVELRRRAFGAFRELLARLSAERPLVMSIDDLHWGDADSGALLSELLSGPRPPRLLLIGAYRSDEAEGSPLLRVLRRSLLEPPSGVDSRMLEVGRLDRADARELARGLLGAQSSVADSVAGDSGGSPLFIAELARYSQPGSGSGSTEPAPITLEGMVQSRVSRLTETARRLLETVAVAARPLPLPVARAAADLRGEEQSALALLRAGHLARTRRTDDPQLETYHDRIREIVVAGLDAATLRERHRRLAWSLLARGGADPETLAVHFQGAGENEAAAEYAATAADQADRALAFDRAARLYRLALELRPRAETEARPLRVKLGDALANAGRGAEAAEAYVAAARGGGPEQRLELQRRAAEQLLRSGHIDEGLAVIREVLHTLDMKLAATPGRALFAFALRRLWIRLRGLGYTERDASALPAGQLLRIDTCWAVAIGLSLVDNIRGADFQARHLLLALKAGEPYRIARALALESGHSAAGGTRTTRRTQALVRAARALSERIGHPHALGLAALVGGVAALLEGRWRSSLELADVAHGILSERCTGVAQEQDTARVYALMALLYLGEVAELSRRLPPLLQDAEARGDLFAAIRLRTRVATVASLAADQPERAARETREAIGRWSDQGFHVQHYQALWSLTQAALYSGDGAAAGELLRERWPDLRRSMLLRVQFAHVELLALRANSALCRAASGGDASSWLRGAEADVREIQGKQAAWADGIVHLLRAGIAAQRGLLEDAMRLAVSAAAALEAHEMHLMAAVARRRLGQLLGGDEGRAKVAAADQWMEAQKILNPRRMADMFAPGRWP